MSIIRSLFGIIERRDIIKSVPWEFWIKPSMMENPFVKEFFLPNASMSAYRWNVFDKHYSEEWVTPWDISEDEFFKLREENGKNIVNPQVEFKEMSLYWYNIYYRII
jgi:hypothetical protein